MFYMLLKQKAPDEIYLISFWHMGDCVYAMSSTEAMLKHYPDKKFVVIGNSKCEHIFSSYKSYDPQGRIRFRLFPPKDEVKVIYLMHDSRLIKESFTHEILFARGFEELLSENANFGTVHQIRQHTFKLPEDSPITYHRLPRVPVTSIKDFESIKHKTVIIAPYSLSMGVTMEIYNNLCTELLKRGYVVFTNVVEDQEVVAGSQPLRCSIDELYSIACEIPLIVSVRSGILDLLAPSDINMFVVYETEDVNCINFVSLKEWECKGKVHEELVTPAQRDTVHLLEAFRSFLDELKAEGRIS